MHDVLNSKSILFCLALTISINCFAGKLQSRCLLEEKSSEVTGENVNKRLPIASVSKVFTSLWAIATKGVESRYTTAFYVSLVADDIFDVHIQGALDPYFSEQSWHYFISQLNKLGVYKIRNLTFDENFKFYFNVNGRQFIPGIPGIFNPVDSQRKVTDPSPELVKRILLGNKRKQWLANYNSTLAKYPEDLVKKPRLAVQSVDFRLSTSFPAPLKPSGFIRSAELTTQLKMMNWNSNNHAANTIFQSLGGKAKFDKFLSTNMKFKPEEVDFHNGSGNNENFGPGQGLYNSASCSAIVRTVRALKKSLASQKHDLEDVMAVVGADKGATVARYSLNVGINDGVIAKSGTILSNVTLAGMISTKKGNYFFAYNFATAPLPRMKKPTAARIAAAARNEWARTRGQIGVELGKLVKSLGGAQAIGYKARPFQLESFEDDVNEAVSEADIQKGLLAADPDLG